MWHRMTPTDARPSMHALPDIAVMTSASGCASALKRYLAGARMSDRYEKTKFRGKDRVGFQLLLTLAGYNLIRMRNILAEVPT